jgi:hypothetical protein
MTVDRKVRLHFSPVDPGRYVTALASACGVAPRSVNDATLPKLYREAASYWTVSETMADADLVVHANDYDLTVPAAEETGRRARLAGMPCLYFGASDDHDVPDPTYGLAYRVAVNGSQVSEHVDCIAHPCIDLHQEVDAERARPLPWNPVPRVGFCGYVSPRWKQFLRTLRGDTPRLAGHRVRRRALDALARSKRIATNFRVQTRFNGGALKARDAPDRLRQIRQQFLTNIFESEYTVCARGAANASIRLYETLAAGRVPVIIDTDCALPLRNDIDWSRHAVIVGEAHLADAGTLVADFHARHRGDAFTALQLANRQLWVDWLEPSSFLRRVVRRAMRA